MPFKTRGSNSRRRATLAGGAILRPLPAMLALGAALSPSLANAAADTASATTTVEDIVVTATRQSTKLQRTPVAVAVIQPEQIQAQNIVTTRDLAGEVPGVTTARSGITPTTQVFFIRGVGDSDPIFDPTVAQYVDDVYLPRAINGMTDLTDIERVEVLRGPQGTLFGENAGGGAIRYITRAPTDETQLKFDIGTGSYNTLDTHLYAAGAVIPGKLDAGLAFAHDQHDGYTYDPTIRRWVNDQDTTGGRFKLLATFRPGFTALLTIDATADHSATAYYTPVSPIIGGTLKAPIYGAFQPNVSYASQTPLNNSWTAGAALKVSDQITSHLTFNAISAYRGFAQEPVNYNNDGQPLVPYSAAFPTPVSISDNLITYREQEATQELQLQGNYNRFDFTTGFYFLYEVFASNRIGFVVSPTAATALPAYPEDQIGNTKTYNYAGYVQGNYHLTDRLTLTAGARYTLEHRDFTFSGIYDNLTGKPLTPVPGAPTSTPGGYAAVNNFSYVGGKSWTSFTPKGGVSYQFTQDIYGYATVSQGFDAGGFNNRASSLATALPYDQETVTAYEGGFKTEWLKHAVRLNVTGFYNHFKGLQETASVISPVTGGYVSVRANARSSHSDGVEIESVAKPIDNLTLTLNASYLETRFDSFPNANAAVVGGVATLISATGNQLPISPHWQLYTAVNYRVPLPVPGELDLGFDAVSVSPYFSDVFNTPRARVPEQTYLDANASYRPPGGHVLITLTARNLADHFAYQSLTYGGTPSLWEGPMNPPRTIFVKFAYTL